VDAGKDKPTALLIRKHTLLALLVVTPLGFIFKHYLGSFHNWFSNYGAGLLYEIFWILVSFIFFPAPKAVRRIPILVFAATCILEILQLWHPWFLEAIRASYLGKVLIGTSFIWWDFVYYAMGCFIGWLLMRWILNRCHK